MFDNLSKDEILDLIRYLDLKALMNGCTGNDNLNMFLYDSEKTIIGKCIKAVRNKTVSLEHLSKEEKSLILKQIDYILNKRNTKITVVPKEKIELIRRFSTLSGFVDNDRKLLFENIW